MRPRLGVGGWIPIPKKLRNISDPATPARPVRLSKLVMGLSRSGRSVTMAIRMMEMGVAQIAR